MHPSSALSASALPCQSRARLVPHAVDPEPTVGAPRDWSGLEVAPITAAHRQPELTIVIPTKDEAENIEALVERIGGAVTDQSVEIVFVDDSASPATLEAIDQARDDFSGEIVAMQRNLGQRSDGLGGAVVRGMNVARASWVCVMDADLQHPPELIPRLLQEAEATGSDVVIASRYQTSRSAPGFSPMRSAISRATTASARLLFPSRLRNVTDPMSGYFLVRREAIDLARLQPRGFKILLEILARTPGIRVSEVPFHFGVRHAGQSKASLREGLSYLRLIVGLRLALAQPLFRFALVGASGLLVNMLLALFAVELLGMHYLAAAFVAIEGSILWNFMLTERWVFGRDMRPGSRSRRCVTFMGMSNVALVLQIPLLYLLVTAGHLHYLLANLIVITTLLASRYFVSARWIWSTRFSPTEPGSRRAHSPSLGPMLRHRPASHDQSHMLGDRFRSDGLLVEARLESTQSLRPHRQGKESLQPISSSQREHSDDIYFARPRRWMRFGASR